MKPSDPLLLADVTLRYILMYPAGKVDISQLGLKLHVQNLPLLWPVGQSGAAVEHNDVILTNLMTSHCFNPIP
jgi:hypothetical protein